MTNGELRILRAIRNFSQSLNLSAPLKEPHILQVQFNSTFEIRNHKELIFEFITILTFWY